MALSSVKPGLWVGLVVLGSVGVMAGPVERLGTDLDAGEGKPLGQSNITFLLEDLSLTDGVLFALSAYFLSPHPVLVQVWRPESLRYRRYKLLWQSSISAPRRGIFTLYFRDLPGVDCLAVHQGDRVGLFAESGLMSIAYTFLSSGSPATLRHPLGSRDSRVTKGQTVTFDALRYPYRYSINAFVDKDLTAYSDVSGDDILKCPNLTVEAIPKHTVKVKVAPPEKGGQNSVGHTGPPGPPGAPGVIYPIHLPETRRNTDSHSSCQCGHDNGTLLHNHVILAIFIWLTALTVLNLAYLTTSCFRFLRKQPPPIPTPVQNDTNLWVEKIRETVREFNGNPSGVTVSPPVGYDAKVANLNYEVSIVDKL